MISNNSIIFPFGLNKMSSNTCINLKNGYKYSIKINIVCEQSIFIYIHYIFQKSDIFESAIAGKCYDLRISYFKHSFTKSI